MIYVGIDNGLSGGIVVINNNENIIKKWVMPVIKGKKTEYDIVGLYNIFNQIKSSIHSNNSIKVFLEQAHVRSVSGKRACFMTGFGYGVIQGILTGMGLGYEIVSPQKWMSNLSLDKKDKKGSINFCLKKYPNEDWTATEKSKKVHDGLTDSCCISLYGKRVLK